MDFSNALRIVRSGRVVTRPSWDGLLLGMMALPTESQIMPFLGVKTSGGPIMAWTPSQQELFAEDWVEVGGVAGHG